MYGDGMDPTRLTTSVKDACAHLNVGRTTLNEWMRNGTLKSVRIGRRRLIVTQSLIDLVNGSQDGGHELAETEPPEAS